MKTKEIIEKLGKLEDLEAQLGSGIVELFGLVGKEVYYVYETDNGKVFYDITKGRVESLNFDGEVIYFYARYEDGLTYWHTIKDFNNDVFLTREEAEAKKGEKE